MIDYAAPGPLTELSGVPAQALDPVVGDAIAICTPVHLLVMQPTDPFAAGLPPGRHAEYQLRPAGDLVARLLALAPTPLSIGSEPAERVVGTYRHFALLSCALLRYRGIAARARCGFATYFQPGRAVDHWITEYRPDGTDRWIRVDTEILGLSVLEHPESLEPGQFLTGGEAWQAHRRGDVDAATFGVHGTDNWGPAEIAGNAVRDLAALNKIEMLPWDEWGRMTEAYEGRTGADYDALLDEVAAVCAAADEPDSVVELYRHPDLRVPDELVR